jgi:hypothetical protein
VQQSSGESIFTTFGFRQPKEDDIIKALVKVLNAFVGGDSQCSLLIPFNVTRSGTSRFGL